MAGTEYPGLSSTLTEDTMNVVTVLCAASEHFRPMLIVIPASIAPKLPEVWFSETQGYVTSWDAGMMAKVPGSFFPAQ